MKKIKIAAIVAIIAAIVGYVMWYLTTIKRLEITETIPYIFVGGVVFAAPKLFGLYVRATQRSFQKKERRSSEERMESYRLNAEARAEARYMSHCDDSEYRYLLHRADERAYRSQLDAEKKHEMELEKLLRANKEGETFEETLARLEARRKEAEAALRGYKKSHSDDEVDRTLDADDSRYK